MYNEISSNKRRTWILIALFGVFIISICGIFFEAMGGDGAAGIILGTIFATIYTLIGYYFSDNAALATAGARQIQKSDSPEIWNLIENMCISQGMPMPKVYLIDDSSPNAFATGRDPEHAAVAMTTGLLSVLNKQELEGVLAHELSHIKNYDIRIMTITVILVGAVMLLSDVLLRVALRSNSRKDARVTIALLLIGGVLAILSPLIANIIKLAVSRTREYLADASGAMITRYPEGLASALEKIKHHTKPLDKANHATAHLYIANPFGSKKEKRSLWKNLFSTHPPIDERIARLRSMGR